jgi:hypothetical protein
MKRESAGAPGKQRPAKLRRIKRNPRQRVARERKRGAPRYTVKTKNPGVVYFAAACKPVAMGMPYGERRQTYGIYVTGSALAATANIVAKSLKRNRINRKKQVAGVAVKPLRQNRTPVTTTLKGGYNGRFYTSGKRGATRRDYRSY